MTAVAAQYPKGTGFRTFRMIDFVVILWLLSPYWGRGKQGMLLPRFHMNALFFIVLHGAAGVSHRAGDGGGHGSAEPA